MPGRRKEGVGMTCPQARSALDLQRGNHSPPRASSARHLLLICNRFCSILKLIMTLPSLPPPQSVAPSPPLPGRSLPPQPLPARLGVLDEQWQATLTQTLTQVLQTAAQALVQSSQQWEQPEVAKDWLLAIAWFYQALQQQGKIVITGIGKSGKIAEKIVSTLVSTGSAAAFLHPTEAYHGDLGLLQSQDVVLALSKSGNSQELNQLIPLIRARGIKVVTLTSHQHCLLAKQGDLALETSDVREACPLGLAPTTSTSVALALGDALAMALMTVTGTTAQQFAAYHPGGALGYRLQCKVKDLMLTPDQLATLSPSSVMTEIIQAATQKKWGAVLVVEQEKLLGLITDGDIRRALQDQEGFFQRTAREIMTVQPVFIDPEALAITALRLMEDRSSQINVLPVINAQGAWEGLLRLHDLAQLF